MYCWSSMSGEESENYARNKTEAERTGIIYPHPFCVKKCDYCDFLSAPADENRRQEYVDALVREIQSYAQGTSRNKKIYQNYRVSAVFLAAAHLLS